MVIQNILPIVVIAALAAFLYSKIESKVKKNKHGHFILKSPKITAITGLLFIFSGIILLIFTYFSLNKKDAIVTVSCSVIVIILGSIQLYDRYKSHLIISDSGIIQAPLFGKINEIKWHEVNNLSFNKANSELNIQSINNKINANTNLIGFKELTILLKEKTGLCTEKFGFNNKKTPIHGIVSSIIKFHNDTSIKS